MTDNAPPLKFCVNCKWSYAPWFKPLVCLHPEENRSNVTYLATGFVWNAEPASIARTDYSACGTQAVLYEAKNGKH